MKRIIATALTFVMMLSLATVCAFAAVDGYAVNGVVAVPENGKTTLSVSVTVPASANLAGIQMDISYNTEKLTVGTADTTVAEGVLAGWSKNVLDRGNGVYRIQAFTAAPTSATVLNDSTALLATVPFTVASGAELADGDVAIAVVDASNLDVETIDGNFATAVEIKQVDKTALQSAVNAAKALTASDYTADSFAAVTTALTAAEDALSATGLTQAQVDNAASALNTAVAALVKLATEQDKAALTEAVTDAGKLPSGDYTEESYKTVQDAIAAANEVLKKTDATEAEIAAAKQAIENAVTALVKVSSGTNTTTDTDNTTSGTTETPNTSDFNLVIYVSVMVVALAAAAFVIVKKKRV